MSTYRDFEIIVFVKTPKIIWKETVATSYQIKHIERMLWLDKWTCHVKLIYN